MSNEELRALHHDMRGALSAIQMNLQTLQALEGRGGDVPGEKRVVIVERAMEALAEAVRVADRIQAECPPG